MGRFASETHTIQGGFKFSAAEIQTLSGTDSYTLVTVVIDGSGSTEPFWEQIKSGIKEIVKGCRRSPRADNLMPRVVVFDGKLHEVHGFRLLQDCNEDDYDLPSPGGMTALVDATYEASEATTVYGRKLSEAQFSVNGAIFIITDGCDNSSKMSRMAVKKSFEEAKLSEALESLVPVLIGVNTDAGNLNSYLEGFKNEIGFQQYVAIGNATEKELAKLGGFISRSISSQSQALGSGGPSKSLTF